MNIAIVATEQPHSVRLQQLSAERPHLLAKQRSIVSMTVTNVATEFELPPHLTKQLTQT